MAIEITKELQNTLIEHPYIKTVYFDKNGRHYFNVFELIVRRPKRIAKDEYEDISQIKKGLFGAGIYSHHQVIPGQFNVDEIKEQIAMGDPDTAIVESKTREEILDYVPTPKDDSLISKVLGATQAEKDQILSGLGLSADVISMLHKLMEQGKQGTPATTQPATPAPQPEPKK